MYDSQLLSDTNRTTQPMKTSRKKPAVKTSANRGVATTFWIQNEDLKRLKEFATKHELSSSNVINRAIRRFISEANPFFRS